jgi:hypothetical protein
MILNNHARLWKISFGDILTIGYCECLGKIKQLQKSHLLMVRFPTINAKLNPQQTGS